MESPIVNIYDAQTVWTGPEGAKRIGGTFAPIGDKLGLKGLGCSYVVVEPGRRAFPFHNHLGNDELFIILEGFGTYRLGDSEFSVRAGDACPAPRGGPDKAHQLINTGTEPLRYIAISTRNDPEIVEYPDSRKFAALAISPGPSFFEAHLRYIGRTEDSIGYFDGEEV